MFPNLDQRVTQWKSENTLTRGSSSNSRQFHETGFSTRPEIRNVHRSRSMPGGPLASSTGHFVVRDWAGGTRLVRRASELTMTSVGKSSAVGNSSGCVFFLSIQNITFV